ncbi:MAG: hypothetical protein ACFE0J_08760 [Elainellaceae cyanobacterium]
MAIAPSIKRAVFYPHINSSIRRLRSRLVLYLRNLPISPIQWYTGRSPQRTD